MSILNYYLKKIKLNYNIIYEINQIYIYIYIYIYIINYLKIEIVVLT